MNPPALLVEDAHEDWHAKPQAYKNAVMTWMRSQGINPAHTRRVEVFVVDAPYAEVTSFVKDEQGRSMVDMAREEFVTAVDTVLLSSLPPTPESVNAA